MTDYIEFLQLILFKGEVNANRKPTNLDRIKNMTPDEMAKLLNSAACKKCVFRGQRQCVTTKGCQNGIKKWLEQEAAE